MEEEAAECLRRQLTADLQEGGLFEALRGEDLLGVVLRSNLWVEQDLLALVHRAVKRPEFLPERLGFHALAHWCVALGELPRPLLPAVLKLNILRNRAAHRLNYEFTVDDERELLEVLDEGLRSKVRRHGEEYFPGSFRNIIAILVQSVRVLTYMKVLSVEEIRPDAPEGPAQHAD